MFRIRFKMTPQQSPSLQNRNKEWTCCFGLHVHTATVLIGIWHLFLNILALSLLAVIWRNPHMMEELENSYDYNVDMNAPALPTPLSKVEPPYAYRDHSLNYRKHRQNFDMGGLVCTCMIAITLMMIYGAIRGKPGHILPFFCLQLFDFAITTLTAAGYLCYLQAIHNLVAQSYRLPWREKLLQLSPEQLVVVVLVVFVCIVFLKAYAIGIVWRCYKYLNLCQQSLRPFLPCVITDLQPVNEERAYSTLLPNYDEAVAQFMKQAPPPSYHVAMANYNLNEPASSSGNSPDSGSPVFEEGLTVNLDNIENNNDASNNNNTMHVNNNTPVLRRSSTNNTDNAEGGEMDDTRENDSGVVSFSDVVVEQENSIPPPTYDAAIILAQQAAAAAATTGAAASDGENAEARGNLQVVNTADQGNRHNNESHA